MNGRYNKSEEKTPFQKPRRNFKLTVNRHHAKERIGFIWIKMRFT